MLLTLARRTAERVPLLVVAIVAALLALLLAPVAMTEAMDAAPASVQEVVPEPVQEVVEAAEADAEAFGRLCLAANSSRGLGIDYNQTGGVAATLSRGTCTGPSRAIYDRVFIPYGCTLWYNNTNLRAGAHGTWKYLSATYAGTVRLAC